MRRAAWLMAFLLGGLALAGPFEQLLDTGVTQGKNGWLFHVAEFGAYQKETLQDPDEKLRFIAVTSELFRQKNIQLVVALVPAKIHLYENQLPDELPLTDTIRNRYTRAVQSLRNQGVKAVDLLTPMLEGQRAKEEDQYPMYQRLDHHFSSRGALIAAKAVTDFIKKEIDIRDLPKATFKLQAQQEEFYQESSLIGRLPKAEQAKYKPEAFIPYELERVSGAGGGLLGGSDPKVVLVGSSASKGGRQWPFEYGIPYNLSTDIINAAQVGRGPWLPMEDYLRDPLYQTAKPRIVVWQLWESFLLDVDQASLPEDWSLTLGGLIQDGCGNTNPLKATVINGAQELTLPQDNQPTDSLVLEVSSSTLERVKLEVVGMSTKKAMTLRIGAVKNHYRLKVPLSLEGDSVQRVRLLSDAKSLTIHAATRCALSKVATGLLASPAGTYSMLGRTDRFRLNGFGDIESNGIRWALGADTSVSFWSLDAKTVQAKLDLYNPVAGQEITVLWNGKPLETWSGLEAEQNLQHELSLQPIRGRNTLTLHVKAFNGSGSDFAKGDARPLSVMFNRFDLGF